MHKSVGAIIKDEGGNKILMIDRKKFPFGWACPAGHIEEGETLEETLIKEVKEETNLNVADRKLLFHEFIDWNKCARGVKGHDWYVYEILKWSGEVKKSEREKKAIKWVEVSEIKNLELEEVWKYWFTKLKII